MSHAQRPDVPLFGVPAQRTPVQFDTATGALRIAEHERRVDASQPSQVYEAYLSLLYAVRGAKPGQTLPLRSADLEALLLIVGDDPETIEQRLIGLMGCTADEARALSGILLRHRKLTATLGIAAALALGAAAVVADTAEDVPADAGLSQVAVAPGDTTAIIESQRSSELEARAPTAAELPPASTTSVVVADAAPAAVAPAAAEKAAPTTGGTSARRASAPRMGPVAPAPAPVAPAPAPAPAAPAPAAPVPARAPAPVEAEPPAAIGEPAFEEAPPEEIGGIADPSIGHEPPVAQPDVALPFPNAPRTEVVVPELVAPVDAPKDRAPAPADEQPPAVKGPVETPVAAPVAPPVKDVVVAPVEGDDPSADDTTQP